jgi:immunoglobulin-binding protein 1
LLARVADADRETVIENARTAYERYLSLLSHYDIFSIAERKLYKQYIESPTTFSTIPTTDLVARRAAKIANFQRERELKQKIEVSGISQVTYSWA